MPTLKLETIKLPNSGINCKIGLTYKEQVVSQQELVRLGMAPGGENPMSNPDKVAKVLEWQGNLYKTIIKEWDSKESITSENIGELATEDIAVLQEKVNGYLNPINKKKVNTQEQS